MFHALLRVGEVTKSPHNLKADSLTLLARCWDPNIPLHQHQLIITLTVQTMKTDQLGNKGQWTWVAKERNPLLCPVAALLDYLSIRPQGAESLFVTQDSCLVQREHLIHILNYGISAALGLDSSYSSHSLRMGGAVYLLMSRWSNNQIMARGRWVTPEVAMSYANSFKKLFSRKCVAHQGQYSLLG